METPLLVTSVDRIGSAKSRIRISDSKNFNIFEGEETVPNHGVALRVLHRWIGPQASSVKIDGIGHRVVLGDRRCLESQLISEALLRTFQEFVELAPDHVPQLMDTVAADSQLYPGVPQAACCDAEFHSRMPRTSQMYGMPRRFFDNGIVRYGFHGLSCEYIMQELRVLDATTAHARVIIAHLGNGSSVTAVDKGVSIDNSMGFTPMAGLIMGTRCGDLDPRVLLNLMNRFGMTFSALNSLLNKESGLLGISNYSADMRDLLERESTDPQCAEAIDVFCYYLRKFIGAYTAALGGLDTLVFTGGIGEHAAVIRERVCKRPQCIGVVLDAHANNLDAPVISASHAPVTVRVIRTNEDLIIARHTCRIITGNRRDTEKE